MTAENPHAGQGMVVLDIGDDIGALIICAPSEMAGWELEICPAGQRDQVPDDGAGWWDGDWRSRPHQHGNRPHDHSHDHSHEHATGPAWPHVAVLARPTPAGPEHAAVFPGLRAGVYDLWVRPGGRTALTVTVTGGQASEVTWPNVPRPGSA